MEPSVDALAIAELVTEVLAGKRPRAALATVVGRHGSAPQALGAKLLYFDDRTIFGTVGGGSIEAQTLEVCRQTLADGVSRTCKAHLVRDLGMCCGGSMEVFVEYLEAAPRLFVVGAGHVAQALVPFARAIGFRVSVLDDREEYLAHPAFAEVTRLAYDVDELDRAGLTCHADDYIVILTRDHARDETALTYFLGQPHAFIGMIGSRRKAVSIVRRILERHAALGRPEPSLARLRSPFGLRLGGRTPAQIALSMAAELTAARFGGDGGPMSIVGEKGPDLL